jgi:hypothetical protein
MYNLCRKPPHTSPKSTADRAFWVGAKVLPFPPLQWGGISCVFGAMAAAEAFGVQSTGTCEGSDFTVRIYVFAKEGEREERLQTARDHACRQHVSRGSYVSAPPGLRLIPRDASLVMAINGRATYGRELAMKSAMAAVNCWRLVSQA